MFEVGNKKMLNMLILDILREYSDERHRLTQQEILRLLKQDYGVECNRRTVKANVMSLVEMGYEISMEDGYFLMEREFEDAELRMLIDSVLFSPILTAKQAKRLIEKLRKQASRYFNARVSYICSVSKMHYADNRQLMYVLDQVSDAISEKKKIRFVYCSYGTDFKLHPKREKPYVVNPYQMVFNHGRYYLIGNYDKYDNVVHFRLDRISEVEILDERVKDMSMVKGLERGINLPKHMAEHIYMFSGEAVWVRMTVEKRLMNDLVDWFGKDFRIVRESEAVVWISVCCNEDAMFYWALQYGPYVEILEPQGLRDRIRENVWRMNEKYNGGNP